MDGPPATPGPTAATGDPALTGFPARTAWDRPGFLLWHATLRWQREVTEALRPLELTHVQFVLLAGTAWLSNRDGPPSQRELADHAGTDAMMTSQVVRVLEQRGLIRRSDDPSDARVKRLRCTPQGRALAARAVTEVQAVDDRFFGVDGDRDETLDVLRGLAGRDPDGRPLA